MKGMGIVRGVFVCAAVTGACLPQTVLAAQVAVDPAPVVTDVALEDGGVLVGQVVDTQGVPLAKMPVLLQGRDLQGREREIAQAMTDANGHFAVRGLRGGVNRLAAAGSQETFRLWKPGTAPPQARQGALLVVDRATIRGQCGGPQCGVPTCGPSPGLCKGMSHWLANPWVVTGIVATSVAIPVAIHNSDGRPASP